MASTAAQGSSNSSAATRSSGEKSPSDDGQKLSSEMVDLAVAELRYRTAFFLEAVQAMMDGTTLAAEQVQNKRTEFLEAGPTTDPNAAILMIALTLVLEGTVGPAIAAFATREVLRPAMRGASRAILKMQKRPTSMDIRLFRQLASDKGQAAMIGKGLSSPQRVNLILEAQNLITQADVLEQDLRGQLSASRTVADVLNKITTFTQDNLVAAFKTPLAVQNLPGSATPLQIGNSPGVEILASAMASASKLRLFYVAVHEFLEADIKHPNTTSQEVNMILDTYRLDNKIEISQIRSSFQLVTEAMIWARLLLDQIDIDVAIDRAERTANQIALRFPEKMRTLQFLEDPQFLKLRADKKYVDYLLVRFRQELERWIAENDKYIPIRRAIDLPSGPRFQGRHHGSLPKKWWESLQSEERVDFLVQYLAEISHKLPSDFKLF